MDCHADRKRSGEMAVLCFNGCLPDRMVRQQIGIHEQQRTGGTAKRACRRTFREDRILGNQILNGGHGGTTGIRTKTSNKQNNNQKALDKPVTRAYNIKHKRNIIFVLAKRRI